MNLFLNMVVPENINSEERPKLQIDETIFTRIAQNDMDAFEEFYRLTERTVYAFVLSTLKNHDDALDVVQDTYLKIRAAAHLYNPMGKPMAWVFTIARNLSISKLRLKQKNDSVEITDLENDSNFSYITDNEDRLVLQAALKILNAEETEIILLHAISGFTHREIANNLEMKLSTVLSKYHRGLKKLKKYLTEQEVI
ncbi:RNA polymerase sigma factor [Acetobacterium woodii]|uniref:Putative RNA polymerase sigma factor 70 n=1 Tax=Acetobacterium woodii (strain ATCC 29683 / DSM 1030 / JCM 2381 / KCTC 1655 / WB1) TaxID=931626 RepID=H6LFE7_ACEWD|nr:RNA polymerase sigma factor [Acetobacterium woodii]AFA49434.1 putative RNA polymerase sigma factor 70 [Acetobacterium woodii DSM 1030]